MYVFPHIFLVTKKKVEIYDTHKNYRLLAGYLSGRKCFFFHVR